MAVNAFWAVVHWLIWDGKVSTSQDIVSSLLSPGKEIIIIIIIITRPWPAFGRQGLVG